jgi:predicted metal-binding membrane protein
MSTVDALLRRERAVVVFGLASLTALAWIYLSLGAGMGMSALDTTRLTLFPHLQAQATAATPEMPGMPNMPGMARVPAVTAAGWATVAAMWWVMMIAMMTPSAAPLVLLYGRVLRHHGLRNAGPSDAASSAASAASAQAAFTYASSGALVFGYLLVWLSFSIAAATLQVLLQRSGLISASLLSTRSGLLSAAVLLAAGIYQLSPLKYVCLRHCRGPVQFLTLHWRPGISGAVSMGLRHGAWCVGCCWMLMALLFVGGIMNLAWVALLALLVLAEKAAPAGPAIGRIVGAALVAWGVATLLV